MPKPSERNRNLLNAIARDISASTGAVVAIGPEDSATYRVSVSVNGVSRMSQLTVREAFLYLRGYYAGVCALNSGAVNKPREIKL